VQSGLRSLALLAVAALNLNKGGYVSVGTLQKRPVGGDDGSGNERDWRRWGAEVDGLTEAVLAGRPDFVDIGRRVFAAGGLVPPGLHKDFGTDRMDLRPRQLPSTIGRLAVPPDVN
jgi:hypothetical protein